MRSRSCPSSPAAGHYSDIVLPEALTRNRRYSEIRLRQTRPIGAHPAIGALVARRVAELTHEHRIDRGSVSLALVGHGTRRHPQSRATTLDLADRLRRRRVAGEVLTAFLDDDPPVEGLLQSAVLPNLVVIPFLIGGGCHVLDDIPADGWRTGNRRRTVHRDQADRKLSRACSTSSSTWPGATRLPRRTRRGPASPIMPTSARSSVAGTVHLVGGGPGDPGLITVRGLQLLRRADVVIHDRLIGADLLGEVRREALLIDVGKGPGHAPYSQAEINDLLVEHARRASLWCASRAAIHSSSDVAARRWRPAAGLACVFA